MAAASLGKLLLNIRSSLDIPNFWSESIFCHNASSWISTGNTLKYLPLFLTWHIWLTRNRCIFEDLQPDIYSIVLTIKNQLLLFPVKVQNKLHRRTIRTAPILSFPAGFFDGASTNNVGGVCVQLLLSNEHYFCFKLGVSLSTNNRVELLELWTLLHCVNHMGLPSLLIHGDSVVIINWFKLTLLSLDGWCHYIRELETDFIQLTTTHIFREHNTMANKLSKEALTLPQGQLQLAEFTNGECIDHGTLYLF